MQRTARTALRAGLGCTAGLGLVLAGFVAWEHLSMGPLKYRALPITATVIDEATGRPVEGAVVAARWVVKNTFGYPRVIHVGETKTGPDGAFHFDGWGPMWRPAFSAFQDEDPSILIYKPGYRSGGGSNYQANVHAMTVVKRGGEKIVLAPPLHPGQRIARNEFDYSRASVRVCYWDGKPMPLEPARSTADDLDAIKTADAAVTLVESDEYPAPGRVVHSPHHLPLLRAAIAEGWSRLPVATRANAATPGAVLVERARESHAN